MFSRYLIRYRQGAITAGVLSGLLVCTLISVWATGCGSASQGGQSGQNEQSQSAPAWKLTLKSKCAPNAAGAADQPVETQCIAKYGFSVDARGTYQVGPGPKGQLRKGVLSAAELATLKRDVQGVLGATGAWGTESHASGVENESDDSLVLLRPSTPDRLLAHNSQGDFYYVTRTLDQAKSLHAAIRALAESHYRLPFGDVCGDAADKIAAEADSIAACQSDADCVYIDAHNGFEVVPPSSKQWILTEDCTAIQTPLVANKFSIAAGAQALQGLYEEARNVCGAELSQSTFGRQCSYDQKETVTQPTCVQNRCQARL